MGNRQPRRPCCQLPVAHVRYVGRITDTYQTTSDRGVLCCVRTPETDKQGILHSIQQPYF